MLKYIINIALQLLQYDAICYNIQIKVILLLGYLEFRYQQRTLPEQFLGLHLCQERIRFHHQVGVLGDATSKKQATNSKSKVEYGWICCMDVYGTMDSGCGVNDT